MHYLSTGSTTSTIVSGVLFEPENPTANHLNRYYSSHASVPSLGNTHTLKEIGGFFVPSKQGTLNYTSIDSYYELDKSSLQPNTVYVYPDPEVYGIGRGNTRTDQKAVLLHTDDVRSIKSDITTFQKQGDIVNDKHVQKHYPYQSREETLQLHSAGISRSTDNVDFWSGESKDIWANPDVYPMHPLHDIPIQDKLQDLLITDDNVYEWKTDIFGNEYALFKPTHPVRKTDEQVAGSLLKSPLSSTGTNTRNVTGNMFRGPHTNYYEYQLSGFTTSFENKTDSLSSTVSMYDRSQINTGHLFFRNPSSTQISPVSGALSAVFIKYNSDANVMGEINNSIKSFDIIKDIIIIETDNFIVLEKYKYNYNDNTFMSVLPKRTFVSVSGANPDFEKFCNHWYDETTDNIFLTKTVLHPYLSGSNYKIIYPNVTKFNIKDGSVEDIF